MNRFRYVKDEQGLPAIVDQETGLRARFLTRGTARLLAFRLNRNPGRVREFFWTGASA